MPRLGYYRPSESAPPSQILLTITSPNTFEAKGGEVLFLSALIKNDTPATYTDNLSIQLPSDWTGITPQTDPFTLLPGDSTLQFFGVKVPSQVKAGTYRLFLTLENEPSSGQEIMVTIQPLIELRAEVIDQAEYYALREPIELTLYCVNQGNAPLKFRLEAETDPECDVFMCEDHYMIQSQESLKIPFQVNSRFKENEDKQFVYVKIVNDETNDLLYQLAVTLNLSSYQLEDRDPMVRIPAYVSFIALGGDDEQLVALEMAGGGIIDAERERYIEYCLRLPSASRNVLYSIDQRLYLGLSEPDWDLTLGDTVYSLTPLTQRFRYGRGGGFDMKKGKWLLGAHYTQNTFDNDYNPKEVGAYVEFNPDPSVNISGNYLHKNLEDIPISNLMTFATNAELFPDVTFELEAGKNFCKEGACQNNFAIRSEVRGRCFKDVWFDIEKIYAGSQFYGYYNDMNVLAAGLDFPLFQRMRANLSYTHLNQHFNDFYEENEINEMNVSPWQNVLNANLLYNFACGINLTCNELLLRAKDQGLCPQYNFFQQWTGVNLSLFNNGYIYNASIALGTQKDYLTHTKSSLLKRYYVYLGKDFSENAFASLFYEGGNIDYYDAKPWRTAYGGTLRYRFQSPSWLELYLQKVSHSSREYELSQASLNFHHTFQNRHEFDLSAQYFYHHKHFPNNQQCVIAYTIPFGMPLMKKQDRGELKGTVFDLWNQCPIPHAVIRVNGYQTTSDHEGRYAFSSLPTGEQSLYANSLPQHLITEEVSTPKIAIMGAKTSEYTIYATPSCGLQGNITLYDFEDPFAFNSESSSQLVETQRMQGVRLTIDRDNGKEIYTCLTDKTGGFYFPKLRPGSWRVYVDSSYVPKLHYLSMNDFILDIDPGENKEVHLKILPESRLLRRLTE